MERRAESFLLSSPCRHGGRTVPSPTPVPAAEHVGRLIRDAGAPRPVSEDPAGGFAIDGFLLIVRTGRIFTARVRHPLRGRDTGEYRRILGCSSIWWGLPTAKLELHRYSYGRRLPGLRFRASPEG